MAKVKEITIGGQTVVVSEFDHTAQQIDDAVADVKALVVTPADINRTVNDVTAFAWHPTKIVTTPWRIICQQTQVKLAAGFGSLSGVGTGAILDGNPYTVIWNGVRYKCTAFSGQGSVFLGNPAISALGDDNGMPFVIEALTSTYCSVLSRSGDTETVTVMIEAEEVAFYSRLPEGFLPESVESIVLRSSTPGSDKRFRLTVDDTGALNITEVK